MSDMLREKRRSCKCCGEPEFTIGQARRQEERFWRKDWESEMSACVCMQPWNSIVGRTCPVHGYSAPMQITC